MRAVTQFVVTAFLLYVIWFLFYDYYLLKESKWVHELIIFETKISSKLINVFSSHDRFASSGNMIYCNGARLLRVGEECSGMVLFALFSGFIVCYPGPIKHKLWYVPLGICLIFLLNIIRMVALSINYKYYKSSFAFNHHVTFTYTVYAFIFILWVVWLNKFGKKKENGQEA